MSICTLKYLPHSESLIAYDFSGSDVFPSDALKEFKPVVGKGILSPDFNSCTGNKLKSSDVSYFFKKSIFNKNSPTIVSFSIDLDKTKGSSLILFHNNENRPQGRIQLALNASKITGGLEQIGRLHIFIDGSDASGCYDIPINGILSFTLLLNPTVVNGSQIRINKKTVKVFTAKFYSPEINTYLTGPNKIISGFAKPNFLRFVSIDSSCLDHAYLLEAWSLREPVDLASRKIEFNDESFKAAVSAVSACVINLNSNNKNNILFDKNIYSLVSPASITKLLTLMTACRFLRDFSYEVTIVDEDITPGSGNNLKAGDIVSVLDLFKNTMLASSNTSATVISRVVGEYIQQTQNYILGESFIETFMREMNKAAFDIASMQYSVFVNPHGLYHKNQYSCAYDLALLIQRCSSLKPITDVWGLANAEIAIKGPNSRVIKIISTVTPIVEGNPLAVGGKTGTLGKSRSLAMLYRDVENNYFSVVTINSNSLDERDAAHNRIINYFVNL